jgi:hypothetical protein
MKRSSLETRVLAWISEPENQAKLLVYGSWIVLGMTVLGYLIMAYFIFGKG